MRILEIFDKFRDVIILKEDCELERKLKRLEELKQKNPDDKDIIQQYNIAHKGLKGEEEIIYQLKKSNIGMYVLHDINLVYEDLKAQIDFILITPWCCYFIECKNLNGNIIINEKGDFIREYYEKGKKIQKGIESPYRQVEAQREVYKKIWFKLQGKLKSFIFEKDFNNLHRVLVVAANGQNILNTKDAPKDMKYNIIKADALIRKLEYDRDHSDSTLWDNKAGMEKWANNFLKLNVNKEDYNDEELKERLIEFRKKRSKENNIPPYYIFTNDELEKLIELKPKTLDELKEAKILSDIKVNIHGREIIETMNFYY